MIDRLVVINDFSVGGGGAAALAVSSAIQFREAGVPVTFISGDADSNSSLREHDIEVVALGGKPLLETSLRVSVLSGLFNPSAASMLSGWIARHDTNGTVYHLHNWSQILSPSVFSALKCVVGRLVLSAHDFFLVCPNGAFANYRTSKVCSFRPLGTQCLTTNCDRRNFGHKAWRAARQIVANRLLALGGAADIPILAIHDGMIPFLVRGGVPRKSIRVVRNPVVPFSPHRIPAERNRRFLYVGRLHEGKGPDLAARAARLAGVPLTLIGDGPLRMQIKRDHPEVEILGWRDPTEIAQLAEDARVLLVPSRYPEPFGLVTVEALWSGLPVVLSQTAFLAPEVEELEVGRSCDPDDSAGFANIMKLLASDDLLVEQMSHRAFCKTRSLASTMGKWTKELLAVYLERLGQERDMSSSSGRQNSPTVTASFGKSAPALRSFDN